MNIKEEGENRYRIVYILFNPKSCVLAIVNFDITFKSNKERCFMIDYIVFYAISAIFWPYNGGELCFTNQQLLYIFQENFPWILCFMITSRHHWLGVHIKTAYPWPITGYIVLSCESYLPRTHQTALGGGSRRGRRFCKLADTLSPACSPTILLYTPWIRKTDFR